MPTAYVLVYRVLVLHIISNMYHSNFPLPMIYWNLILSHFEFIESKEDIICFSDSGFSIVDKSWLPIFSPNAFALITLLTSFPVLVLGKSSTNIIFLGQANLPIKLSTVFTISSFNFFSISLLEEDTFFKTMYAVIDSPFILSGISNHRAASATA